MSRYGIHRSHSRRCVHTTAVRFPDSLSSLSVQLDAVVSQSSPIVRTSVPLEAAHSPLHDETQASTPHNDSISTTTGGTRRGNWEEVWCVYSLIHSSAHSSPSQVLDNDSGGVYYYNHLTGESQWDAPVEFRKGHFFASAAHKLLAVSALAAIAVKVPVRGRLHPCVQCMRNGCRWPNRQR